MQFYPSRVTVNRFVSKDAHHAKTYSAPSTLSCMYEEISKVVKDSEGKDVRASAWLQFPPGTTLREEDKLTLPSWESPKIVSLKKMTDHMGRDKGLEVYLGEHGGGS